MIKITRGLNLPLEGEPKQTIADGPPVRTVGLMAADSLGLKPRLAVSKGDRVKKGQALFEDEQNPGVVYVSPKAGKVADIHYGAEQVFQSIVIQVEGDDEVQFPDHDPSDLATLTRAEVRESLLSSGLWTAFRTRPFSKVPSPRSVPHSIFVTAIDTNPHAPHPGVVLAEYELPFIYGLEAIRHLTDGPVYLCKQPGERVPGSDLKFAQTVEFAGPHPAGLAGTHIHFLDPVSLKRTVWWLNYQDVIAIGILFDSGRLWEQRIISLGGPVVNRPRLLRTTLGANLLELTEGEIPPGENRLISGSVLSGRAVGEPNLFLGRYHLQVSALREGGEREFLGGVRLGLDTFSMTKLFASAVFGRGKKFALSTSQGGSRRAMIPFESYEQVMPLDILPAPLLRALLVDDTEVSQALGCLELDEEDLALLTYVCPSKHEYGPLLRKSLTVIEADGLIPAHVSPPDAAGGPQAGEEVSTLSATGNQKPDRE
jgi:Na+-transporting NADH:ubiquinone oxidoreductase subunit A